MVTGIFLLGLIVVCFPAFSEVCGGYCLEKGVFLIKKEEGVYRVYRKGKAIVDFKKLYAYGSNGKDCVCFLTDGKQIVFFKGKRIDLLINPSVFYLNSFPCYENFFVNNNTVYVADSSPYLYSLSKKKKVSLKGLCYKFENSLFLVRPEYLYLFDGYMFFLSNRTVYAFSLNSNEIIARKFVPDLFLSYAEKKGDRVRLFFDYGENCLSFDLKDKVFRKEKRDRKSDYMVFNGRIRCLNNVKIEISLLHKGLEMSFKLKVKVSQMGRVLLDKTLNERFAINEENMLNVGVPFFSQLEGVVVFTIVGKRVFFYREESGKVAVMITPVNRRFYILDGRVIFLN